MTTFSYSQSPSENYPYSLDPNHIHTGTWPKQNAYKESLRDSWWHLRSPSTRAPVYHSCDTYQVGSWETFILELGIYFPIPVLKQNCRLPQFLCAHAARGHKCLPQVRIADKDRDTGGDCLVARIVDMQVQYLQSIIRSQFDFFS